jgi:hypothetical protein
MFKGLSAMNFSYSNGNVSASNGWSYSIRGAFDYQYQNQPQYKTLADGYRYLANMAIGIADDDYRAKYGVMPGTNQSEFGQWIDGNRQAVYNEAQGWFTYVPAQQPPSSGSGGGSSTGTGNPSGGSGSGSGSGTGTGSQSGSSGGFELPGGMTMWIIGGLALFLMMKR